jgi:heme/copper-type cytochrome/quinol oxidase subunit 2
LQIENALFNWLWDYYMFWSILVSVLTFTWLYHHSFWYTSKDGEEFENPDMIEVGVFPKHNDDMRLEVAWTIAPFLLIVWLTYVSWAPLNSVWAAVDDVDAHGFECEDGFSSNNEMDSIGMITSECYHVIEITGKQWVWQFDCLELSADLCDTSSTTIDVYGTIPVLHLKEGETYLAVMTSEDVTHAPWFLELGMKEDVQPGQETSRWLAIPDGTSDHIILCAEYCGDAHSVMAAMLDVHS